MKRSLKVPESISLMNRSELVGAIIQGMGIIGLFGYFFYRSWLITIMMSPLLYFYLIYKGRTANEKRNKALILQFKEMLNSVNSSIQAGYSIENAFIEAEKDLKQLFGSDSKIVKEISLIKKGLENNCDVIELITNLAERTGIEEIESFAEILSVGIRSGGNISGNMESFVRVIEEKAGVMQEIDTMVSARRFEQKIMNVIPFVIIFYVELTNKGFFGILYHNIFGNLVMTITMIIYLLSVYLSDRIIDIRI